MVEMAATHLGVAPADWPVIANEIARCKATSIDAISKFPFVHKEFVNIGEKVQKGTVALKDLIQFSEFDDDNLPKLDKEQKRFLKTISEIKKLGDNEEKNKCGKNRLPQERARASNTYMKKSHGKILREF